MMDKLEVAAFTSASAMTVYEVLLESGVVSGLLVVDGVPFERVDLRGRPGRLVTDHFGRIELIGLSDGGTLIRWRVVFRAGPAGTRRPVRWWLRRSTSRRARRLARFAAARDYDAPPY